MFPFQKSGELSFHVSNDVEQTSNTNTTMNFYQKLEQDVSVASTLSPSAQHHLHHQGQLANNSLIIRSDKTRKGRSRSRTAVTNTEVNNNANGEDETNGVDIVKKRTLHREIERQRRQEMTNLYSSLRSLLPMEYIKGKRSISDHITEATRFIKDLEKSVKELGDKRDKLKGASSSSESRFSGDVDCSTSRTPSSYDCSVRIHTFSGAVEVEISVGLEEDGVFPLSRVLKVLIEQGLNVVSCVSSKVNQRWIYVIHCEVNDVGSIDPQQLQLRLTSEISSHNSSNMET